MVFAAIDWAEQSHMLVVLDAEGKTLDKVRINHDRTGFGELDGVLLRHGIAVTEIPVAIELNDGLLLDWLLRRGYRVYGLNPRSAERARERYTPAGLKDDERDAWAMAEFLRTSHPHLRALKRETDQTLALREWVRLREDLVQERTVQLQRLRSHLVQWNPHLLQAVNDLNAAWTLALLEKTPTANAFAQLKHSAIEAFAKGRRMSLLTRDRVLTQATFPSPTLNAARNEAHAAEVRHRVQSIRHLNEQIAAVNQALAQLIENHPDANLFRSLPVKGAVTTATLLAAFGEDRDRWNGPEEVAARWGVAPVTQQSGKHRVVKRRMACDTTVHQTWLWFSFNTVRQKGCWASTYYREKRAAGTDHYTALRCLAQRWVRIVYRVWYDRAPYNEQLYRQHREQRAQPKFKK
jgi:transposase